MIKIAFFDIDGTLSAPCYPDGKGGFVIGFSVEDWEKYCNACDDEGYLSCGILPPVKEFAGSLAGRGAELYVLSAAVYESEKNAKRRFISEYYPSLFKECLFTEGEADKVPLILQMAAERSLSPKQCLLVEDTYKTLLSANDNGIAALHVSNLMSGNQDILLPRF